MDQRSMLNPTVQAARLCSIQTVNTADCAAPMKLIHVVSDSCAGYLFNVIACIFFFYRVNKVLHTSFANIICID